MDLRLDYSTSRNENFLPNPVFHLLEEKRSAAENQMGYLTLKSVHDAEQTAETAENTMPIQNKS